MDYRIFKPDKKWVLKELIKIIGISGFIGYLFFGNLIFALTVLPFGFLLWRTDVRKAVLTRKNRLAKEFKDMLISLSGNLNAGYSLERAFYKTQQDLTKSGETYQFITNEIRYILYGLECNKRVEELINDFALRSDVEDIKNFSELVMASKIYGGNMVLVIRQTVNNLSEKYMVEDEIDTLIAAKRLEGRIMLVMPFLIILYMKLTNRGYMNILYETLLGRVVMAISLLVIIIAGMAINKIVEIEV